ncbi:MAG: RlmE family RNA methyltransferase [Gammaproteobacteria bacterium]|nr:RlmE family RNA methyltransferase [Pseudomonadota bacterium]MCH8307081.1 RlmE family RNA methyltransferase [Pseudomonadota bacterium]TDJ10120.1 MAG: RlmE family RNA methyltransferase [Gammaproteobacteria bacterium]
MNEPRRGGGTWRDRQERDPYVLQARRDGWRSRAVYKLEQIIQKEQLLKPDMTCVDLGAAPGSWSQYVTRKLKGRCRIIALDILPMDALPSVEQIQGDFTEDDTLRLLLSILENSPVDLVLSDMAPNISGNKALDQPRSMHLAELALDLAKKVLRRRGNFVCKLFQGQGTDAFVTETRKTFERVKVMKPKASRPGSSEVYLVARNYRL